MLHFHIITLFPESIEPYLSSSIVGRARERGLIKISYYNPKEYTLHADGRVDRRPYGGGPGMVLEPESILRAFQKAAQKARGPKVLFFATDGALFSEPMAQKLAREKHIILIAGRYEGVDARVQKITKAKKVSIGAYVLTGGELPAAVLVDAVSRFVTGVLGKRESLEASRISSPEVYTRPEVLVWKKKRYRVPAVLLSGNHAAIEAWKRKKRGNPA